MPLALFDLDNTLLSGDSDHLWGHFLADRGVVDGAAYRRASDRFYRDYQSGKLDIFAFLAFSLRPLADNPPELLAQWHAQFMRECIEPLIGAPALNLVEQHRRAGDTLLIITATNAFVTRPIATRFGIEHLIATEPEQRDGRYTGQVAGVPSFREGKVQRLEAWMAEQGETLEGAWFYSDSHNDIPLLERVTHPVVVDPDPTLARIAAERQWPVLSLHTHLAATAD